VRLPRSFAIANRPVTFGEFDELMSDRTDIARIQYDPRAPRFMVSWYDAAAYCNRLSQSAGLPPEQWCYETNEQGFVTRLRENHLSLSGYRLPTEAELEYAVRAGAKTRRCYGEADELLVKYAWYVPNSAGSPHPVAQLLPNDYGLFDPLGNLWSWCQDSPRRIQELPYSSVIDDLETDLVVENRPRALRGGCYTDHSFWLRSAYRWERDPTSSSPIIGFRVARTIGRD
jgi:formylglycine-generating enzyme required for sulfatase activity